MNLVVLLVLDSLQVTALQADLERFDTYDLVSYEIAVEPLDSGARVDCRITVKGQRFGRVRFFLSREIEGLAVERDGEAVDAEFAEWGLGAIAGLLAPRREDVPKLLSLPGPAVGETRTYRVRYVWRPAGKSLSSAAKGAIQTHLASGWVPSMPHKFFDVKLSVKTSRAWVATQGRSQVVCLVVGDYERHRRGGIELLVPKGRAINAEAILDDAEAIGKKLGEWFGPALSDPFRIVFDPGMERGGYCAGPYVSLAADAASRRGFWLPLLAHEMAHAWWGHKLATPVVGAGGTWLREGLAEWSAIRVVGTLLGAEVERQMFRSTFKDYFVRLDLRRPDRGAKGVVFANEATLMDATYADHPAVPYKRGALVHRLLEREVGVERFRAVLREFAQGNGETMLTAKEYARRLGVEAMVAYYVGTTRMPDFCVRDGKLVCLDPAWPGKSVPCVVDGRSVAVELGAPAPGGSLEIDPERIYLDPVVSNNRLGPR